MTPLTVITGEGPIILGQPHVGTFVPEDVRACFNDTGLQLADTDWHIERLYEDLLPDATVVRANFHRYVIDANRDPVGESLYPGQNTTTLCPLTDFEGTPIYRAGHEPDAEAIARRTTAFHRPYHAALEEQIARVKAQHGFAIVFDCHSIRSRIPFLFDGVLPDFNIGTDMGKTCAAEIESAVRDVAASSGRPWVLNGRFRGGWTTRHYGRPQDNIHAIQLELTQSTYLADEAAPWVYDSAKADGLRVHLQAMLQTLSALAPQLSKR